VISVVFHHVLLILLHWRFGQRSRIYRYRDKLSRDLDRTLADFGSFLVTFLLISNMEIGGFSYLPMNLPVGWA